MEEHGAKIWLHGVRITNRDPSNHVSLNFGLDVKLANSINGLASYRCGEEEEVRKLNCFPIPLAIAPQHTETGSLVFLAPAPAEEWIGDLSDWPLGTYLLTLTDLVSGRSHTHTVLE